MFSEISQRKTGTSYYHLNVKSKKKKKKKRMNEYGKQKQPYRYRGQTSSYLWERGRGEATRKVGS